jgi:hypothetical protein
MNFAYVAHTEAVTFLLDAEGVCRWFIPKQGATEETLERAEQCVGAQYVASLDRDADGLLVHLPKPGARLLFARVSASGRVALVRSGPLLKFEDADSPVTVSEMRSAAARGAQLGGADALQIELSEADLTEEDVTASPHESPVVDAQPAPSPDAPAITARRPLTEAEASRLFEQARLSTNENDDSETAPFSTSRPASRPGLSPDETEPPTTKRGPHTVRGFPPPPVLREGAPVPSRRGMLPRSSRFATS